MLQTFVGEFFFHPCALDYSGNTCSNACAYCFANIRTNSRSANLRKLHRFCTGQGDERDLAWWFFRTGYPVCVSNKSDPLAASNADNTPIALQLLDMVSNGVMFQTKGVSKGGAGYAALDAFKKRNVVLYVTVDTLDERLSKLIEPGAPLPQERLALMEYGIKRGWMVICAVNPCWPPWMPDADFDRLLPRLREIGVKHLYLQTLNLSKRDKGAMGAAKLARLPNVDATATGATKNPGPDAMAYYWRGIKAMSEGFDVHIPETPFCAYTMPDAAKALGKGLNSAQSFVNHCWERLDERRVWRFEDFLDVMFRGNEELNEVEDKNLYQYIMSVSPDEWRASIRAKRARTFEDVYRVFWNSRRMHGAPLRESIGMFKLIEDGKGGFLKDDYGNNIYYFQGREASGGDFVSAPSVRLDDAEEGKGGSND